MKHLIDIMELTTGEIDEMIAVAKDIIAHPGRYAEKCKGKKPVSYTHLRAHET